ncbi:MAG: hypothetical protein NVSMB27_21580 [Ktedonobacteraceae bacterium]
MARDTIAISMSMVSMATITIVIIMQAVSSNILMVQTVPCMISIPIIIITTEAKRA